MNADAFQLYRGFDIGTAKTSREIRENLPHHLIDILEPSVRYTAAEYSRVAREAARDIVTRGKRPIVVGGTGQYVWALLEGWRVPRVPPDPELRTRLEQQAAERGTGSLVDELRAVDPLSADRIDPRNVRRCTSSRRRLSGRRVASTVPSNRASHPSAPAPAMPPPSFRMSPGQR